MDSMKKIENFIETKVLLHGSTYTFIGFSKSGCDALFKESGVGYNSNRPTAKEWFDKNCKVLKTKRTGNKEKG